MTPSILSRRNVPSAVLGSGVAFVVGERLVEAIRPALLLDPEPGWIVTRFALWMGLFSATSAAGALAAALFFLWSRSRIAPEEPQPLPFRGVTLVSIGLAALAAGALFRFAWLETLPVPLWLDDVSLIEPTLALHGTWRDFSNSIRPSPYGVAKPFGSVGVLYLELYRLCLTAAGTTVFGVRLPSALAGAVSVATAMLLGRALLPRGGGAMAGLALAGMRWNLIFSRWGWNAIVLAPILDVSALLVIAARQRRSRMLAAAGGLVAGLATHIYLASWVGVAALLLLAAWPGEASEKSWRPNLMLPLAFAVPMALAAGPLFLLDQGRTSPYFARASDHNVSLEIRREKSVLPLFGVAADALVSPWFLSDPTPRHDLANGSRLGWVAGTLVAVALAFALVRPRRDFSAYLLASGAAAFAATVVGGRATVPNGYRYAYLSNVAAVAAAGGALVVLGMFRPGQRRAAGILLAGLLAISSMAGARDAIIRWAGSRLTFDDFWGQDTLLARAAARWDRYGAVELDPDLGENLLTIAGVRRYRLDPWTRTLDRGKVGADRNRRFRIVAPDVPRGPGERLVERVTDAWGRDWGRVFASSATRPEDRGLLPTRSSPTRAGG